MRHIYVKDELSADPGKGQIPFDCTLGFRASSDTDSLLVNIAYDILENENERIKVAFDTTQGPTKRVWRRGVEIGKAARDISKAVRFVEGPGDEPPGLVALEAKIFPSRRKRSSPPLETTRCMVRILPKRKPAADRIR